MTQKNSVFYQKYLKYKEKYLGLKNTKLQLNRLNRLLQLGGSPDFNALVGRCAADIQANNALCPNCKFFHGTDVDNIQSKLTKRFCNQFTDPLPVYFYDQHRDNPADELYRGYDLSNPQKFLNPRIFTNISSYNVDLAGNITIQRYPNTIHTFCAEGNIVWVNKQSKVGTVGITSCFFVLIILNDESKLCIHHALGDIMVEGIDGQKNYTNKSYLRQILEQVKGNINSIKYIGSLHYYYNYFKQTYIEYLKITQPRETIQYGGGDGHYIIDDSNNIILLKSYDN
jgi:hypothetical protein